MAHVKNGQTVENKVEARQGETSGHMRWVLAASLALVVIGFAALTLYFNH